MAPRVVIAGLGTARPSQSIAQADAAELAKTFCAPTAQQARLLPTLYGRTGVQRRGSVVLERSDGVATAQSFFPPLEGASDQGPTTKQRMERYAQEAAPLAQEAASRALGEAGLRAAVITQLITVSCTGFVAPGIDLALIKGVGLAATVGRTHIGFMGCHGALNGLRVASALARAQPEACVLLCAVELCSLHFRYGWDPEKVVANALFADGAGAMVLASDAEASRGAWGVVASGSCLVPDSEEAMTWRIGDHGFEMTLSARVPAVIRAHLRSWLEPWLHQSGLTLREVRSWAIHPGGPRILDAVAAALDLPEDATALSAQVLAECGNMSSATMIVLLERLHQARAPRPCVALGFGPGLVAEAALFL